MIKEKYLFTNPIEMPRGSHYGNNFWIMPSRKLGRNVKAFSNLEHEFHLTLEMDANVEYYCEQPLKESIILDGVRKETVFDVYIHYKNGTDCLREVKYSMDLEASLADTSSRIYKQIEAQTMICKQRGINYGVVTEKDIHKGKYTVRNLELLAAKVRRYTKHNQEQKKSFVEYLKHQNEPLTFGTLIDRGRLTENSGMDLIAVLVYEGLVRIPNMDSVPLGFKTEVCVC